MSELKTFLDEIGIQDESTTVDVLTDSLIPEEGKKDEDNGTSSKSNEEHEHHPRNRRERRLEAKYQAERESSIALAAKLAERERIDAERNASVESDYLKSIEKIYGTDSPEAIEATELLKGAFKGLHADATKTALETLRAEQEAERRAAQSEEANLDAMIEDIEDQFDVEMTPQTQKAFFTLLERMSPKDRDGNIIQYADHTAVWEMLQSQTQAPKTNRAKDLSDRSMVQSGSSKESKLEDDSTVRFLKQHGII